jgi:hypothetical protein
MYDLPHWILIMPIVPNFSRFAIAQSPPPWLLMPAYDTQGYLPNPSQGLESLIEQLLDLSPSINGCFGIVARSPIA